MSSSSAQPPAPAAEGKPSPSNPSPANPQTSASAPAGPSAGADAAASSSDKIPALRKNDPKRTGFDPQTSLWVNVFKALTGQIDQEGQYHMIEKWSRDNERKHCGQCEAWRDWNLQHSPTVRFLREQSEALGGRLDADNIRCRRCPAVMLEDGTVQRATGAFSPDHGVLLCANLLRDRKTLEDTLAHEMVHAWDHLRWKVKWTDDPTLRHAACTEIRASMLSGECRWTREVGRGNFTITQQFQNCVRERATLSLMARPMCKSDVHAAKAVNSVWDSCFRDTRPFDEVYR
ncbi:peptidase M76 family-domain-containing protein [Xylariaceae sp. FL0804]|nr:peptidase M76 family-domain-containing protein [Xylariaceae sp. FL0804]